MPQAELPTVQQASPDTEAMLHEILKRLAEIRMTSKEERGQGFLINAEKNIEHFLIMQRVKREAK